MLLRVRSKHYNMKATIFDIKEFSVRDGKGIRTTVFFKGCPLRCAWCHNPEGLSALPELYELTDGCLSCNLCRKVCKHPDCQSFGRCLHICPKNLLRAVGKEYPVKELAQKLLAQKTFFDTMGGGITLSGGEPLLQAEACTALLQEVKGKLHTTIETSGYASTEDFVRIVSLCDFVIMDLKLMDDDAHKKYTGVSNVQILANAKYLMMSGIPHLFRTPLIPGITDTAENLHAISDFIGEERIELLPYNELAPAKYAAVHRVFSPEIDSSCKNTIDLSIFKNAILKQ